MTNCAPKNKSLSRGLLERFYGELRKLISQAHSSRKALSAHDVLASRQLSTTRISIYARIFFAPRNHSTNFTSRTFVKNRIMGVSNNGMFAVEERGNSKIP